MSTRGWNMLSGDAIDVLIDIRTIGIETFNTINRRLIELQVMEAAFNQVQERTAAAAEEVADKLDKVADRLGTVRRNTASTAASMGLMAGMWAVISRTMNALRAPNGWAQVVTTIAAASIPLASFATLIVSATGVIGGFVVGATAMLALLGSLALGFAALSGAVIALGIAGMGGITTPDAAAKAIAKGAGGVSGAQEAVFKAQQNLAFLQQRGPGGRTGRSQIVYQQDLTKANEALAAAQGRAAAAQGNYNAAVDQSQSPINVFLANLDAIMQHFEQMAVPITTFVLNFASKFFPMIQTEGDRLFSWVTARMPGMLSEIGKVVNDLMPTVNRFAGFIGNIFDQFSPQFGRDFEGAINAITPGLKWLVNSLVSITNWFIKDLPIFAPVMQQIFGFVGDLLGGIGGGLGAFAEGAAKKFPTILSSIQEQINQPQVKSGWDNMIQNDLPAIGKLINDLIDDSPKLLPALMDITEAILGIAAAFSSAGDSAGGWLGPIMDKLSAWANNNDFWGRLQTLLLNIIVWIQNVAIGVENALPDWFKVLVGLPVGQQPYLPYYSFQTPLTPGGTKGHALPAGQTPPSTLGGKGTQNSPKTVNIKQNVYGMDSAATARQSVRMLNRAFQS